MKTLFPILLLPVLLAARPSPAAEVEKPNILFIMVDDLGKDWIGCYGADGIETPHIDALAATGLRFRNAYSMPQCTPSRVTLLTGQYPWRTGWVNHWDVPRWGVGYFDWREYTTFASILRNAGYATAIAGKWQINDFRLEPRALEKHGFDDWCVWTGYESLNPPSAERYWNPYIHSKEGSRTHADQFGPDIYADFLIDFIRRHREEPMMLYWPMALTHGPLVATPAEPQAEGNRGRHGAMVRYTDHLVGRVVRALEEIGLREQTMIFFTTDNGSGGGVVGTINGEQASGGKGTLYEGGVCQPFIVSCPGLVPEGKETEALTDFSDLLPTFADLAGAPLPTSAELDGRSIAPVLLGTSDDSSRQWILSMGYGPAVLDENGIRGRTPFMDRALRDERYKAWVGTSGRIERIYDLQEDPWEKGNLIDSEAAPHREASEKFQRVLEEMPKADRRPRYAPRAANTWDKEIPQR